MSDGGSSSGPPADAVPPAPHAPDGEATPPAGGPRPAAPEPASRPRLTTGAAFVFVVAAVVLALLGFREVSALFAPVFLGLTLVITIYPLRRWLTERRVPGWAAGIACLLILYAVILAVVGTLVLAVTQLADLLPQYRSEFNGVYQQVLDYVAQFGVDRDDVDQWFSRLDYSSLFGVAQGVLAGLGSAGTTVLFILLSMTFIMLDLGDGRRRIAALDRARPYLATALHDFSKRIRKYWLVSSIFGLLQAGFDVIALIWLGIPMPLLWGVLVFFTNFIPNIGFVLGLIPPALLALLDGGVTQMVYVIVAYSVISFVLATLILPKFAGDAVGLSTTVTFLSLVFWSVVIGPMGALLAVPLTMFFKSVLVDSDPRTQWIGGLLVSSPLVGKNPFDGGSTADPDDPPPTPQEDREARRRSESGYA